MRDLVKVRDDFRAHVKFVVVMGSQFVSGLTGGVVTRLCVLLLWLCSPIVLTLGSPSQNSLVITGT